MPPWLTPPSRPALALPTLRSLISAACSTIRREQPMSFSLARAPYPRPLAGQIHRLPPSRRSIPRAASLLIRSGSRPSRRRPPRLRQCGCCIYADPLVVWFVRYQYESLGRNRRPDNDSMGWKHREVSCHSDYGRGIQHFIYGPLQRLLQYRNQSDLKHGYDACRHHGKRNA